MKDYKGVEITEDNQRKPIPAEILERIGLDRCCENMTLTKTCAEEQDTFCLIKACDNCGYYKQSLEAKKNSNYREHPLLYLKEGEIDFNKVDMDRVNKSSFNADVADVFEWDCYFDDDIFCQGDRMTDEEVKKAEEASEKEERRRKKEWLKMTDEEIEAEEKREKKD